MSRLSHLLTQNMQVSRPLAIRGDTGSWDRSTREAVGLARSRARPASASEVERGGRLEIRITHVLYFEPDQNIQPGYILDDLETGSSYRILSVRTPSMAWHLEADAELIQGRV